jgi:hypothetical protein
MRGFAEIVGGGIGRLFTGYMLAKQGLSHWEQGAARAAPGIELYLSLHKEGDRARMPGGRQGEPKRAPVARIKIEDAIWNDLN